jgi:hypothetical protein
MELILALDGVPKVSKINFNCYSAKLDQKVIILQLYPLHKVFPLNISAKMQPTDHISTAAV